MKKIYDDVELQISIFGKILISRCLVRPEVNTFSWEILMEYTKKDSIFNYGDLFSCPDSGRMN